MINGLNSVLTIFIMISIGFYFTRKGIFDKTTSKLFSKIVINISLPLMIIVSLPSRFTKGKLLSSLSGIAVAFISILTIYVVALLIVRIFKIEEDLRGSFIVMFTFSNTIFIGLPINISLYGESAAPYVFLYYLANTSLFLSLGIYYIRKHGHTDFQMTILDKIKRVFSPPFIGFLLGLLLIFTGIRLPKFMVDAFTYVGKLTIPLSMFFIGILIYNLDFKNIRFNRVTYLVIMGRFIIAPAVLLVILRFIPLSNELSKTFFVEASMPIITQAALFSEYYDSNSELVSLMVSLTTLLCIFIIPIYALLGFI